MDDKNARSRDRELAFRKGVVHYNNVLMCIINIDFCGQMLLQRHTESIPHQSLYNNILSCSCFNDSYTIWYTYVFVGTQIGIV